MINSNHWLSFALLKQWEWKGKINASTTSRRAMIGNLTLMTECDKITNINAGW